MLQLYNEHEQTVSSFAVFVVHYRTYFSKMVYRCPWLITNLQYMEVCRYQIISLASIVVVCMIHQHKKAIFRKKPLIFLMKK